MTAVIVGIGITCSCGESGSEIDKNIMNKDSGISPIDYFDTSELSCGIAGNLSPSIWKKVLEISKNNQIDWSSSLSVYTIKKLMDNYKIDDDEKVGLSLGTCNGGIHSLAEYYDTKEQAVLRNYPPYIQSYDISRFFNFNGPKYCFNSACAASANAIAYGAEMIENDDADVVISGGCDPMSEWVFAGFNSLRTFNSKNCMPYGKEYGLNLGEAATFFIIESKNKALENGHKIYAEILGHGLSNDAHHPTAPDKEGAGIAYAINMALKNSGLLPKDILYINSHGTGTKANDSAEYRGFKSVFGSDMPFISSMKGYVGHNLGAAASTELAISLIGISRRKLLYPNYNLKDYRDDCNDNHILRDSYDLTEYSDINFINNNAAFGGQNVAVVFHVNLNGDYDKDITKSLQQRPVYINGYGIANDSKYASPSENGELSNAKPLKVKYPRLYKRRMNSLTQISIIAAKLALDSSSNDRRMGLVYGTPFGSLMSTQKYVESIKNYGFKNASGAYFPDLVMNSTTGHICQALSLKDYSSSISTGGDEDIKSLVIAHNAINKEYVSDMLVGAGQENTDLGNRMLSRDIVNHATFLTLSSKRYSSSIAKVSKTGTIGFKNQRDLLQRISKLIGESTLKDNVRIIIHNNNDAIQSDEILKTFNDNRISIEKRGFADSSFVSLINNLTKDKLILMSISQINDLSFIEVENL